MLLTVEQQAILAGESGRAVQKALQILVALGKIYAAERLIPISSVQVAGVSFDNLGEAGLQFLEELRKLKVRLPGCKPLEALLESKKVIHALASS